MILERLGWEPDTGLQEGLEETYRWIYDEVAALADLALPSKPRPRFAARQQRVRA